MSGLIYETKDHQLGHTAQVGREIKLYRDLFDATIAFFFFLPSGRTHWSVSPLSMTDWLMFELSFLIESAVKAGLSKYTVV